MSLRTSYLLFIYLLTLMRQKHKLRTLKGTVYVIKYNNFESSDFTVWIVGTSQILTNSSGFGVEACLSRHNLKLDALKITSSFLGELPGLGTPFFALLYLQTRTKFMMLTLLENLQDICLHKYEKYIYCSAGVNMHSLLFLLELPYF